MITTVATPITFSLKEQLRAIVCGLDRADIRRVYHFSKCLSGASDAVIKARILETRLRSYRTPERR